MSKIIAIWGSPNSGKTTLAVKIATELDNRKVGSILVLHTDNTIPVMPVLFPFNKDLHSIGVALSAVDITQFEILQAVTTPKGRDNLGFLGYVWGDNQFSYPAIDKRKASDCLSVLKSIADYVIVDCSSLYDNVLSHASIADADIVIKLATPDLNSMTFFQSQTPLYIDCDVAIAEAAQGLTLMSRDTYQPVEDCKQYFSKTSFVCPYCTEIKDQWATGTLINHKNNKAYNQMVNKLADDLLF